MNLGELAPLGSFLVAALALATAVYNLFTKPGTKAQEAVDSLAGKVEAKVDQKDFDALEERVRLTERGVTELESDITHMPDKDMAHRMEMAIARLEGKLETMNERLTPVSNMASRMQDYLMDEARSK